MLIHQKVNMKNFYEKVVTKTLVCFIQTKQKRDHSLNFIWFNPPINKNASTNVAKRFLNFIDQHFAKSKKLHAIFNRNNLQICYSCTQNMSSMIMIKPHNKKVINKNIKELKSCNCRVKSECPLNGQT